MATSRYSLSYNKLAMQALYRNKIFSPAIIFLLSLFERYLISNNACQYSTTEFMFLEIFMIDMR